jgi:hypothetical protein
MSEQQADYAAIEQRLAARTPGEWQLWEYDNGCGRIHDGNRTLIADTFQQGDRQLIAHAPEDIAYLLARVRRYEAALRSIADVPCNRSARDHEGIDRNIVAPHVRTAAAALADDTQPPAG